MTSTFGAIFSEDILPRNWMSASFRYVNYLRNL
jgi:hypothetical protein